MDSDLLKEALEKFPDSVSNYEALDLLASSLYKKLVKMNSMNSQHFIEQRDKYFAVKNLRDSLPVVKTKSA